MMSSIAERKATSSAGTRSRIRSCNFERRLLIGFGLDRIAQQRFAPAVAQEVAQHTFVGEGGEEHFLVIAREEPDAPTCAPAAGGGDDPGAVGTAVDQIAQENDGRFGRPPLGIVGIDLLDHRRKQVEASVNVADGIDPLACRNGGRRQGCLGGGEKTFDFLEHGCAIAGPNIRARPRAAQVLRQGDKGYPLIRPMQW
jgi:hypothetical protein